MINRVGDGTHVIGCNRALSLTHHMQWSLQEGKGVEPCLAVAAANYKYLTKWYRLSFHRGMFI